MRVTRADLASALAGAKRAALARGIDGAELWYVGTMGGHFLYLLDGDARKVLELGATLGKAFDRLHNLTEDLYLIDRKG